MKSNQFARNEDYQEPAPEVCPRRQEMMNLFTPAQEGDKVAQNIINDHCQSCHECHTFVAELVKGSEAEYPSVGKRALKVLGHMALGAAAILTGQAIVSTNRLVFGREQQAHEDFQKFLKEHNLGP